MPVRSNIKAVESVCFSGQGTASTACFVDGVRAEHV